MLLSLPYANIVEIILEKQEIEKNIFTLYQIQKGKLRERREKLNVQTIENRLDWKKFFKEDLVTTDASEPEKKEEGNARPKKVKPMMLISGKEDAAK